MKHLSSNDITWVVKYSKGSFGTYFEHDIFVSRDTEYVESYVKKFNEILKRQQGYWDKYLDEDGGYEIPDNMFRAWHRISEIQYCFAIGLEERKSYGK